jgi:hypothetical protein
MAVYLLDDESTLPTHRWARGLAHVDQQMGR